MAAPHLPPRRKSSVSGFYYPRKRTTKISARDSNNSFKNNDDSISMSDTPRRRLSGELISMKDFLSANKVSLAVMQKQLYETAQNQRGSTTTSPVHHQHQPVFKTGPGAVGPLAIASEKFSST